MISAKAALGRSMNSASIAVIVIGRNEGDRLRRCLASIPQEIGIIYVDSRSTDDSVAFAKSLGIHVIELDMSIPFTAARARNAGVLALNCLFPRACYVQFLDGDCVIEAGWLDQAAAHLDRNPSSFVVCGRRRERFPDASVYNRWCDAEWNTPVGEALACGGDAMMRMDALRQIGLYDETVIAGEEPELCARFRAAGGRIWRIDAPMTVHDAAMHHLGQWWHRTVRCGFGYAQVWHLRRLYDRELK